MFLAFDELFLAFILISHPLVIVGITGLEPATSRPPDVCATNCAKSRCFALKTFAKVELYFEINKKYSDILASFHIKVLLLQKI